MVQSRGRSPAAAVRSPRSRAWSARCGPGADCGPTSLYVYRYWDIPYAVTRGRPGQGAGRVPPLPPPARRPCRAGCGSSSGGWPHPVGVARHRRTLGGHRAAPAIGRAWCSPGSTCAATSRLRRGAEPPSDATSGSPRTPSWSSTPGASGARRVSTSWCGRSAAVRGAGPGLAPRRGGVPVARRRSRGLGPLRGELRQLAAYRAVRSCRLAPTSSASSRPPTWRWPRACGPSRCRVR